MIPPKWLMFEGRAYRLSDEMPDMPPWTHVERAFRVDPKYNPLGGAARGVGRCTCLAGPGTNPGCQVHP